MGHYRSEMGLEEEDRKREERRREDRERILDGVKAQMKIEGTAAVIADLIQALADARVYVSRRWEHWD